MRKFDREFKWLGKDSENKNRFKEVPPEGEPEILQQVYVPKWIIKDKTKGLKITIEIPE